MNTFQNLLEIIQSELEPANIEYKTISFLDCENNNYRVFHSLIQNRLYLFSFNNFYDHTSYEKHMGEIINRFNHYFDLLKSEVEPSCVVMKDILPLSSKLKQLISLFKELPRKHTSNIIYERIDKEYFVSDLLNRLFTDGINGPRMQVTKFQHLQYLACKKIYNLVTNTYDEMKQHSEITGLLFHYHNKKPQLVYTDNKLSINATTSNFSAFIHVVNEVGGILNEPNISELSRKISRMFTTSKSGDMSYKYVRNMIHKPNKRDLEVTRDAIISMLNVVNKELKLVN